MALIPHLSNNIIVYSILAIIFIFLLYVAYYNLKPGKLVEKFQDTIAVASGAASETLPALPESVIKESCKALAVQIDQYKGVKQQYPDTEIRNLDETLKSLNKHYRDRQCYQYE
jgi:hypothetical protein